MTLIHESSWKPNEPFGQSKHYIYSTRAFGPLWSHGFHVRSIKRCHALLETEIWQIVSYPPSGLMINTNLSLNCATLTGWLPSWRILLFDIFMSDGGLHWRKMKLLGGERDADERRHGLTALHLLYTAILLMFYMFLQDVWHRKAMGMYGSDQLPLHWKQDQGVDLLNSLVPVARSWQERVTSSDQRHTALCVIVCCWMLLVILIVHDCSLKIALKFVQASAEKQNWDRTSTVMIHDANIYIYGMRYHIELRQSSWNLLISFLCCLSGHQGSTLEVNLLLN